jgi:hypothetical protein
VANSFRQGELIVVALQQPHELEHAAMHQPDRPEGRRLTASAAVARLLRWSLNLEVFVGR